MDTPERQRLIDELLDESRRQARLQNPQRSDVVFSEPIPYNKAIRLITGQSRLDRARERFEEFLTVIEHYSDPGIPLRRLPPQPGQPLKWTLAWCEEGIPKPWIERLTKYFALFWDRKMSEQNRLKGEKTAFRKKKRSS